jgi:hypothetical protein
MLGAAGMATIKHHEDLYAWQLATKLKERVFENYCKTAGCKAFQILRSDPRRQSLRTG